MYKEIGESGFWACKLGKGPWLKKYKTLLPKNTIGYISKNKNNINIDSYQDLALAKVFLK